MMNVSESINKRFSKLSALTDLPKEASDEARDSLRILRAYELLLCERDPVYWFNNWCWTYNPKNVGTKIPSSLPLDLFPRQEELVRWFENRMSDREDGLLEKSRDIGFTWVAGGVALHGWLFKRGFKVTFGSRKAEYVDRIGDPDSIFEKIRMLYRSLPGWMWPARFSPGKHDRYMLLENPHMGTIIRGESGDEMGRGGRSSLYVIDEAAFLERAEKVEAATSANTEVRIWGSSVNGNGNFFARKRFGGTLRPEQIFRFHWTDDPRKRDGIVVKDGVEIPWSEFEQKRLEVHDWASEYDIDYAASAEGICIPAKWVEAAKRISMLARIEPEKRGITGGDVGAGGKAKSVAVARFGAVVVTPEAWNDGDTINTANTMVDYCNKTVLKNRRSDGHECKVTSLHYDSVGVGKGVQDGLKRRPAPGLVTHGVNVGVPPTDKRWPDGQTAKEKFANLKAEAWWTMRERFKNTYEMVLHLEGKTVDEGAQEHPLSECIQMPSDKDGPEATKLAAQLSVVKWERDEKGKIAIQSKKSLAKDGIVSPDHADALALTFAGTSVVDTWIRALG